MKFGSCGYSRWGRERKPMELAGVSLAVTPIELRKLAKFIEPAADELEKHGSNRGHEHLADHMPDFKGAPAFIAMNPDPT